MRETATPYYFYLYKLLSYTQGCIYYSKYLDFQKPEEKGGRNQVKKEEKEDLTYIMRFFDVLFTMVIQKNFFIFLISNGK